MKTLLTLVITAIMAVAAQAVMVTWDDTHTTATINGIESDADSIRITATIVVAAEGVSWGSDKDILSYNVGGSGASDGYGLVTYANGIGVKVHSSSAAHPTSWSNTSVNNGTNAAPTAAGTYDITLLFTKAEGGWNIECAWEGGPNSAAYTEFSMNQTTYVTDSELGLSNGSFTLTDGKVTGITVDSVAVATTVPEPTALALIALGVAGLALKRKVA